MHHFFLPFVDDTFVPHKLYPIPHFVCKINVLDRYQTTIREDP